MQNHFTIIPLPSFSEILAKNPGYLDEAIDTEEAARILNEAVNTLIAKRGRGGGPRFIKQKRAVKYTRRLCFEYMQSRVRTSTSDLGEEAV